MNRRYMLFERNGKYREATPEKTAKNLKLIDIFEHFVVLVDNNNKYFGTLHGFDVLKMNNSVVKKT